MLAAKTLGKTWLLTAAWLWPSLARGDETQPVRLSSHEVRLANQQHVIVKSTASDGLVRSPDARHLAYVFQQGAQQVVAVDGKAGRPYDAIEAAPIFSPDSRRVAYVAARVRQGSLTWHLVVDGIEGAGYDGVVLPREGTAAAAGTQVFSPDGRRTAYIAIRDDHSQSIPTTPVSSGFVVSPDGYVVTCAHLLRAAVAIQVTIGGREYPAALVANDTDRDLTLLKIDAHDAPALPLADTAEVHNGDDVRLISYPVTEVLGANAKVMRGSVSGRLAQGGQGLIKTDIAVNPGSSGAPLLNDRGEVIGVVSVKLGAGTEGVGAPSSAVRDLLRGKGVRIGSATAAPRPKLAGSELFKKVEPAIALVAIATTADLLHRSPDAHARAKQFMVVDGVAGAECDEILAQSVAFSLDSARFAYAAAKGGCFVMIDGVPQKRHDQIEELVFSPDGHHLAYFAWRDRWRLVVLDGQEGKEYDAVWGSTATRPVFSPDSTRLAYGALREFKSYMVVQRVGGQSEESRPAHGMPDAPIFSPDSKHLAFRTTYEERVGYTSVYRPNRWRVVVDGRESREFQADPIPGGDFGVPLFSPDSRQTVYRAAEPGKRGVANSFIV